MIVRAVFTNFEVELIYVLRLQYSAMSVTFLVRKCQYA